MDMKECKLDLLALMREEGLPLYVYADGTVTHKMVPGKVKIGKIWGCLEGVEPKEKLRSREAAFSRPFTEEDARKQAEEDQRQRTKPQEQETVQVEPKPVIEKSVTEVKASFSEVKVGWYAFAGGKFSPDPDSYPNCQGVVGWVNPDKSAPKGQRGLIVTRDQREKQWSRKDCKTYVRDQHDGKANTEMLIAYGKAHGISFPAAEWCNTYCWNGVKAGEGFLPALTQLERIIANRGIVNPALERIDGVKLGGWIWSSSEYSPSHAWDVLADNGAVDYSCKYHLYHYVRCVLAF